MVQRKYTISNQKASPFGGLHSIAELLNSLHFDDLFVNCFGKIRKERKYCPSENIKLLMASILSGGDRIADVNRMNFDPVIPDLFGNGSVPYGTTISNDLKHIGKRPDEKREFLFRLNDLLLKESGAKHMTIDIDGTATMVSGHQSKATKGYNHVDKSSRCFQHVLVSWDEMDSPLYIETREGSTHCAKRAAKILKKILDHFAPMVDSILIRGDSGFYGDKVLKVCEYYKNVKYVFKATKNYSILDIIDDSRFNYYHDSKRQYTTYKYAMLKGKERTYYVERRCIDDGLKLWDELNFDYEVIVSNLEGKQAHKVFERYNYRARQEKLICDLKNDFALGMIVSKDFRITQSAAWVSAISCTIIAIFRKVALRLGLRKLRMKRLRYYFFNVVAVFVQHAREKVLKILSPPIGQWRYDQIMRRIHALA